MNFDDAFTQLVGNEGGYTSDPTDRGNWTTGTVGYGKCLGTKYGISAMAYPGEDIPNLTLDRAKTLYQRDYWGPAGCDAVPDALKFDLFDMAVNQGVKPAVKALQHAVGQTEDGVLGPHTLQAIQATPADRLMFRFDAARLIAYTDLDDAKWSHFGRGWVRRVAANMMRA